METHLNREQSEAQRKASVLIEALPYIQKFNRKIVVIKYGGSAMNNEELQRNVIKDVTLLKLVGFKPITVYRRSARDGQGDYGDRGNGPRQGQ